MAKKISQLRTAVNTYLDNKAAEHGENTDLTIGSGVMEEISRGLDEVNETWNENLPTRPNA